MPKSIEAPRAVRLASSERFPLAPDFVENADGTFDILNVAFLYPVKREDFDCSLEWMQEALRTFEQDKRESHYLPVLKFGHVRTAADSQTELATTGGLVDNMRLVGDVLYGNFIGVPKSDFQALKEGRFPYPSIEAMPSKHRITAVAMLGCTLSQLKLPPVKFEAAEAPVVRMQSPGLVCFAASGGPAMELDVNELAQAIAMAVVNLIQQKSGGGQPQGTAVQNAPGQTMQGQGNQAGQAAPGGQQNAQAPATAAPQANPGNNQPPTPPQAGDGQQARGQASPPPKPAAKEKEKADMADKSEATRLFTGESLGNGGSAITNAETVEKKVTGKDGAEQVNTDQKGGGSGEVQEVKAEALEQARIQFRAFCVGLAAAGTAGMDGAAIDGHVSTMLSLFKARDEAGLHRYQAQIAQGPKVALGQRMGGMVGAGEGRVNLNLFDRPVPATSENAEQAAAALAADARTATLLKNNFGLNLADKNQRAAVKLGMLCQDGTDVVNMGL